MAARLTRIQTFLYRAEVLEPVKTSFGSIPRRSVLLLRVEDSDGAHGWGEIWCNFPPYSADNKARLVETVVAPVALGTDCDDPKTVWHGLTAKTRRWAIQSGEFGPISACLAGLDLALWDMASRKAGLPLRMMLGGSAEQTSVPAYASGLNPDSALATIERARESGFGAFKVKVAFGLQQDLAVIDGINRELMPGERLMVDANQGWDMPEARIAVARMSERNLGWIEEPIPADSPAEDWAELAMLAASPIAGGENVYGFSSFSRLISQGSHRVVQPDVLKWGGITGCLAVARQAVASGLVYCPHWLGSSIGLTASAHLLSVAGGGGVLEHDVMENPLREPLGMPFPRVREGKFPLPATPGLGVEPDIGEVSRWLVEGRDFHKK